ncbi:MAG TPA: L-seryl-tRNA(Sec) selenium transferase [bacterium]|nr:L-seryl-tRNA(Sec) selenium transferase [bacterium]
MHGDPERPSFRRIPSVERLLQGLDASGVAGRHPRRLVVACVRDAVERARRRLAEGRASADAISVDALVADARALLEERSAPSLDRAVNATGIIIHTNLGRAPLCGDARRAIAAASGYSVLEVDRATGERGSRQVHVTELLRELTGAEAAFVVNNNAAAVLVALAALSAGKEVVVSRGELVEIGGSFRMPDVMAASGCRLVEVGTTNKTYLADYEAALTPETALLVKVHRSNFSMRGFVREVAPQELAALGRRAGVPVLFDMGSGAFLDLTGRVRCTAGCGGLSDEPTVPRAVASGADLVTASGDKLLGGPQAGLMLGRASAIARIRAHPLARAMRIDKLDLAALEATLRVYRDPERAWTEIPVLEMLARPVEALERAAAGLVERLRPIVGDAADLSPCPTVTEAGGGALPGVELASWAVAVRARRGTVDDWEQRLRRHRPPVFARIADGRLLLDLRTICPEDEATIAAALGAAAGARPAASM